jgi:flagellar motility protein MotE (MotC chaperone)
MRLMPRLRLLPIVAVAATTLLGFKVSDLLLGSPTLVAPPARAQATSVPPSKAASQPNPGTPNEPPKPAADTHDSTDGPDASADDPQSLKPSEIEVLQQLSKRRAALDQRAAELEQREVLLQAAEKRIDDKIVKLQELQNGIANDLQKRGAEDDARLQSLVKIYEAMKPKDAAQIFEQLDMPVLLSVLQRMKELKTAPILAAMDPAKARAVTMALAAKRNNDAAQGAAKTPSSTPQQQL